MKHCCSNICLIRRKNLLTNHFDTYCKVMHWIPVWILSLGVFKRTDLLLKGLIGTIHVNAIAITSDRNIFTLLYNDVDFELCTDIQVPLVIYVTVTLNVFIIY